MVAHRLLLLGVFFLSQLEHLSDTPANRTRQLVSALVVQIGVDLGDWLELVVEVVSLRVDQSFSAPALEADTNDNRYPPLSSTMQSRPTSPSCPVPRSTR